MNDRIKQIIEYYGISVRAFEQKIFVSEGTLYRGLSRNSDFGSSIIVKILNNCPEINCEWLVLGKGEMLKKDGRKPENCPPKPYDPISDSSIFAAEDPEFVSQPLPVAFLDRYDAAQQEIGSLRDRLAAAAETIAKLTSQLSDIRKKTPSLSDTTAMEPILV